MASLTIRGIDDSVKEALRLSAARHGHSMEEEARQILRHSLLVRPQASSGLGSKIVQRFADAGGVDLPEPVRSARRAAPDFSADGS